MRELKSQTCGPLDSLQRGRESPGKEARTMFEELCGKLRSAASGAGVEHQVYGQTVRVKFYIGGRSVVEVAVMEPRGDRKAYKVVVLWPAQVPTDAESAKVFAGVVQRAAWVAEVAESFLFEKEPPIPPWDEAEPVDEAPELGNADAMELAEFANNWAGLGSDVTDQVLMVLEEGEDAEVNVNAIQLAVDRIGGKNQQIDAALAEFMTAWGFRD